VPGVSIASEKIFSAFTELCLVTTWQFSLTLELTRLVPLGPAVSFVGSKLARLAREVTSFGSDVFVEESVAAVFGRLRLCPHFDKTFRMSVGTTDRSVISDVLDIALSSGPGPTVQRALTATNEDYRYLSTVVQMSLLTHVHDVAGLADGLYAILENRLEGAPPDHPRPPDMNVLYGTLRACREQTDQFQWHLLLESVTRELGAAYETEFAAAYPQESVNGGIDFLSNCKSLAKPVLQGLVDMLLAVQSLPDDRKIRIKTLRGVPTIVVWVYHIHAIRVQVNVRDKTGAIRKSTSFGVGQPQVVIDAGRGPDSIYLLSVVESEVLFNLVDDTPEKTVRLEPSRRYPLGQVAETFIMAEARAKSMRLSADDTSRLLQMVATDAVCYGLTEAGKSLPSISTGANHFTSAELSLLMNEFAYQNWGHVGKTILILFGVMVPNLERDISSTLLKGRNDEFPRRRSYVVGDGDTQLEVDLQPLSNFVRTMNIVDGLEDCVDFPLAVKARSILFGSPPDIWTRQGRRGRSIEKRDLAQSRLLNSFSQILFGFNHAKPVQEISYPRTTIATDLSLVSDLGWSVFLPTVGIIDPYEASRPRILLRRGIPVRNGAVRRCIADAGYEVNYKLPTYEQYNGGNSASLNFDHFRKDRSSTIFKHALVGMTMAAFVVSFVFESPRWGQACVGMREMHRIVSYCTIWEPDGCGHEPDDIVDEGTEETDTEDNEGGSDSSSQSSASSHHGSDGDDQVPPQDGDEVQVAQTGNEYFLLATAGNIAGRWLALCLYNKEHYAIIRNPRTCLRCIVGRMDEEDHAFPQDQGNPEAKLTYVIV
jgi:hypothetical protein